VSEPRITIFVEGEVTLTPVEVVTVPPHPRRPAGPYCKPCGQHTGHWAGCQNTETEGDPVTYNLPDAEGEALDPDDDPVECTCYTPDPDDIGECRTCRRLVIGATP